MATKSWQDEVRESAHKIWLAGLGALAVAEQEGSKLFNELVQQGERYEEQTKQRTREVVEGAQSVAGDAAERARKVADSARQAAQELWGRAGSGVDESVARALQKVGVPTRDEIAALSRRVEELTRAVERLRGGDTTASPVPRIVTEDDVTTTQDVETAPK
jgi:poly(hydroxyalkanoate) granule-associated protein